MKVRDIIIDEAGLIARAGSAILGKVAGKGAKALAPHAVRQADKVAKVAEFKNDISLIGGVIGNWFKIIKNVALAWGIAVPVLETGWEIYKLNGQLKANKIEPVEYEKQVQYWLGRAVTQIVAIGFAKFSVSTAGRLIGSLPFGKTAGLLIQKLSGPSAAAFGVYLTTPAGAEAFTKWFIGESFLPLVAEFMREWVGSWAKAGYDTITGHEDARGPIQGDGENSFSNALADIKPSENPYGMKFDPATGNWINR